MSKKSMKDIHSMHAGYPVTTMRQSEDVIDEAALIEAARADPLAFEPLSLSAL